MLRSILRSPSDISAKEIEPPLSTSKRSKSAATETCEAHGLFAIFREHSRTFENIPTRELTATSEAPFNPTRARPAGLSEFLHFHLQTSYH